MLVTLLYLTLCNTVDCVAHQASLSMGFSSQEYWSGQPSPSPGDLSNLGIKPASSALQADSLPSELPGKPQNTEHRDSIEFIKKAKSWFSEVISCLWSENESDSVAQSCLFVTPWTTALQTLSMEILQARILEWVAIPFSRGSSQPRNWTQVSCIAGRFFIWATREALETGGNSQIMSVRQWKVPN